MAPIVGPRSTRHPNYKMTVVKELTGENGNQILKDQIRILHAKFSILSCWEGKNGQPDQPSSEYSWLSVPRYPIPIGPSVL